MRVFPAARVRARIGRAMTATTETSAAAPTANSGPADATDAADAADTTNAADAVDAAGSFDGAGSVEKMARDLHSPVVDWFGTHARDLPWRRREAGAWGVMVSEFM